MKQIVKSALLYACIASTLANAQEPEVDRSLYPDYSSKRHPDYSLLSPQNMEASVVSAPTVKPLPDHVNNAETSAFPPVFNQAGGSYSAASRIGYMVTHETNAYPGKDGKQMTNRYPSHFVCLADD